MKTCNCPECTQAGLAPVAPSRSAAPEPKYSQSSELDADEWDAEFRKNKSILEQAVALNKLATRLNPEQFIPYVNVETIGCLTAFFLANYRLAASAAPPSEREAQFTAEFLKQVTELSEVLDKMRLGTGGAVAMFCQDAYEKGWQARAAVPQAAAEPKIDDEFIALVEDEIGHGAGAWDMVGAEKVCKAVLKVARAAAVPAPTREQIEKIITMFRVSDWSDVPDLAVEEVTAILRAGATAPPKEE